MSSVDSQSSASGHNKPYDTEEELLLIQLKQSGLSWLQVEDVYNRTVPQDRKRTIYALQNKWRQLCRDGIVSTNAAPYTEIKALGCWGRLEAVRMSPSKVLNTIPLEELNRTFSISPVFVSFINLNMQALPTATNHDLTTDMDSFLVREQQLLNCISTLEWSLREAFIQNHHERIAFSTLQSLYEHLYNLYNELAAAYVQLRSGLSECEQPSN
ncbi:hypothetical protein F9C07_2213201 [Aspergillus flavus]|uniref:Myb-like domain-containing protein n=1 Tax=Aspergillus flavus (strain ATCC 200026 / FGSC A1120 / IAM 13836 / NRRL 3357 / JCM 12722 / SRRC 167) TaxID=332952 RepID=A0A7U2MVJ9_ASPFN|nr:hypothetical protein F9C07_2213201 [Aspergillus flavus]RAQ76839.1 hypothetical protein COH21_008693 [Aspergillus flavus]